MKITWEKAEKQVSEKLAKSYVSHGMLKAHLTVLLVKNVISYGTSLEKVQQKLKARYNVEYKLSDIEDELTDIKYQEEINNLGNDIKEDEEDFFESY